MKKGALTLGFLAATFVMPGHALEEAPYLGVDGSAFVLNTSTADLNITAVRLRIGSEFTNYLGLELQGAWGITDDTATIASGKLTGELQGIYGLYLRPQYQIGDVATIYGVAGFSWSRISLDAQAPNLRDKDTSEGDISAGIGAELKVFGNNRISVDYMEYTEGLTALSAGIRIPF